jgi:hypothetical protein
MKTSMLILAIFAIIPSWSASIISRAEYFVDTEPGLGYGTEIPLSADSLIDISWTVDTNTLNNGPHKVYYRLRDNYGHWSFRHSKDIFKFAVYAELSTDPEASPLVKLEYFVDTDPGFGLGTTISFTPSLSVDTGFIINTSSLSDGPHKVYYRFKDSRGHWSDRHSKDIFKFAVYAEIPPDPEASLLVKLEYFVDTDPGFDHGTDIAFTPTLSVDTNFIIDTSSLSDGPHKVYYRFKDSRGHWSDRHSKDIFKFVAYNPILADAIQHPIVKCEYFVDIDPGPGLGRNVPVTTDSLVDVSFIVETTGLSEGAHRVYYRFQDSSGKWSYRHNQDIFKYAVYAEIPPDPEASPLVKLEYFVDTDPGFDHATTVSFTPTPSVDTSFIIDTSSLSNGPHKVYYRFKDNRGHWSDRHSKDIFKFDLYAEIPPDPEASPLIKLEYFVDTDPGFDHGTTISFTPTLSVDTGFIIDTSSLSDGPHKVYYRFKDSRGHWSDRHSKDIFKFVAYNPIFADAIQHPIVKCEYFVDTDPGPGLGSNVPVTADSLVEVSFIVETTGLSEGAHRVYYRFQDSAGHWSYKHNKDILKYATATDLFISEYVEGTSYQKAIEIFNGTGAPVNLANYSLKKQTNGAGAFGNDLVLSGTLADNDVYVIVNSVSDSTNLVGQPYVDLGTTNQVINFDGNDAVALYHTGVLIDVVGIVNEATNWGADVTLVRNPNITSPTPNFTFDQWTSYPVNTFTYLGNHTFTGGSSEPLLVVNVPNANVTWYIGQTYTIRWFSANITGNVKIILYNGDVPTALVAATPNTGSWEWTIPETQPSGNQYKIKISTQNDLISDMSDTFFTLTVLPIVNVTSVAQLRAANPDGTTVYRVTGEVLLTYQQTYRHRKYFQDSTGGIVVDDYGSIISRRYQIGDAVTNLMGTLRTYHGLLQLTPVVNLAVAVSSGNDISMPVVTINELHNHFENYESRLVCINTATFLDTSNPFIEGTDYIIHDVTGQIVFRTNFLEADYIGQPVPTDTLNILAICTQYDTTYELTSRFMADFVIDPPLPASNPTPISGTINVDRLPVLSWSPGRNTQSFDLYLWRSDQTVPATPILEDTQAIRYTVNTILDLGTTYYWRIDSHNLHGKTIGDVWQFTVLNYSDLQVSQIDTPLSVYSGNKFEIAWTVTNTGLGETTNDAWYDRLYISAASHWESSTARLLGSYSNVSYLGSEDDYDNTVTVTMPLDCMGSYYVYIVTDATNRIPETNEGNNITRSLAAIVVTYPPSPDLIAIEANAPSYAFSGATISINWHVSNNGEADITTASWSDGVYLSQDINLDSSDIRLGTHSMQGPLLLGQGYINNEEFTLPNAIHGEYYILVKADCNNQIYEYLHEQNNIVASDTMLIYLTPPPDLVVSSVSIPQTVSLNMSIEVIWQVSNFGTGPTVGNSWVDRVFVSTDSVFSLSSAIGLTSVSHFRNLEQHASYHVSVSVTIPDIYPALTTPLYIYVFTDYTNNVFEYLSETNNTRCAHTTLHYPDLVPISVIADSTTQAGGMLSINWIARNYGSGAVINDPWLDAVYITQQPGVEASYTKLSQYSNNINLNSGQTYNKTEYVSIPHDISGLWYVVVKIDNGNAVFEAGNENNNTMVFSDPILIKTPDLVPISVIADSTSEAGGMLRVHWLVGNYGSGSVINDPWLDAVYITQQPGVEASYIKLSQYSNNINLNAGQTYEKTEYVNIPSNLSGLWYGVVKIDDGNTVFEAGNENNNSMVYADPISIKTPDLSVTSIMLNRYNSGESVPINYTVSNIGQGNLFNSSWVDRIYLSADNVLDPNNDFLLDSINRFGSLYVNQSYTQSRTITLPNGIHGSYYFIIISDANNAIFENLSEDNNIGHSSLISVGLSPSPDLYIYNISTVATAAIGDTIAVTWFTGNQGTIGIIGSIWKDKLYLSQSLVWNPAQATLIYDRTQNSSLNPGGLLTSTANVVIPAGYTGQAYLYAHTDAENNIYEYLGENNNISEPMSIEINPSPLSDLYAQSISSVDSVFSGQVLQFSGIVTNSGNRSTNAGNWFDRVYLSADQTLNTSDDILVFSQRHTGDILPGSNYSFNGQCTIPNGLSGVYYIFLDADADHNNQDINWTNNIVSRAIYIRLTPPPDLKVTGLNWSVTPSAGQPLSVSLTVSNVGTGPTLNTWYNAVYLSSDQTINSSDVLLWTGISPQQLVTGASSVQNMTLTLSSYLYGNYYLIAYCDYNNSEFELLNDNNKLVVPINITLMPSCDLVVENVQAPSLAYPGSNMEVNWSLRNLSSNAAQGWMREGIYVSSDNTWDINDVMVSYIDHVINIPAYGTDSGKASINSARSYRMDERGEIAEDLPGVPPGEYYILVRTDLLNNIPESIEDNNTTPSITPTTVEIPEIFNDTAQNFSLPGGAYRYYSYHSQTGETVRFSLSGLSGNASNELFCSYSEVPTRGSHEYTSTQYNNPNPELIIPSTQPGYYYVLIYSSENNSTQQVRLNVTSLPFSISSVQPNQGGNTGEVTLKLTGARFFGMLSTTLYNPSTHQTIQAKRKYYRNGSTHYVTFDLNGVPMGTYDIVMTSDSLTTTLAAGFQVIQGNLPSIETHNSKPASVRLNSPYPVYVRLDITNTGNNDILLEDLILLNRYSAPVSLDPSDFSLQSQVYSFHISEEASGLPILRPGNVCTADFYAKATSDLEFIILPKSLVVGFMEHGPNTSINWTAFYHRIGGSDSAPESAEHRYTGWLHYNLGDSTATMFQNLHRLQDEHFAKTGVRLSYTELLNILETYAVIYSGTPSLPLGNLVTFAGSDNYQPPSFDTDLDEIPLQPDENVYVITHGYAFPGYDQNAWMQDMKASIGTEDSLARFIVVDWTPSAGMTSANDIGYMHAAYNVEPIGNDIAVYLELLGIPTNRIIGVGHGLGAHVIEAMSGKLVADYPEAGMLLRMYLIDPAGPGFESYSPKETICKNRIVYHARSIFGNPNQLGYIDIYLDNSSSRDWGLADIVGSIGKTIGATGSAIRGISTFSQGFLGPMFFGPVGAAISVGSGVYSMMTADGDPVKFWCGAASTFIGLASYYLYVTFGLAIVCGTAPAWVLPALAVLTIAGLAVTVYRHWDHVDGFLSFIIPRIFSVDPNEILQPAGYGDPRWVNTNQQLLYSVLFENDQELATASAQTVRIEVPVDEDIEPSSFKLGSFGFANQVFQIPANRTYYQQRLDVRDSLGVYVDVVAGINVIENKLFWIFQTIDPVTGLAPLNSQLGFFPVNDSLSHKGEGFVSYSVIPRIQTVTGETINSQASIVFDNNQPILTEEVFNTIDAEPPISHVNPIANAIDLNQYGLTLQASDGTGSGVAYRQLYMQTDNNPYELTLSQITENEVVINLALMHVYKFFSLASDNTSNLEAMKNTAELTIDLRWPGTIIQPGAVSGVWTQNQGPYHVLGGIWVEQGAQLHVNYGTQVIFYDSTAFNIFGKLQTTGASFSSAAGISWQGIRLEPSSVQCVIQNCTITGDFINSGRGKNTIRETDRTTNYRFKNGLGKNSSFFVSNNSGINLAGGNNNNITSNNIEGFYTGIRIKDANDSLLIIEKNMIKNCAKGVTVFSPLSNIKLLNNTIFLDESWLANYSGYNSSAIEFVFSSGIIKNNTIYNYANALYAENSSINVTQNIFWRDNSTVLLSLFNGDYGINYNDIAGGWPGENNINDNPDFKSSSTGNFSLLSTSPCIDAGNSESGSDSDGTIPDLGAVVYLHRAAFTVENQFVDLPDPVRFINKSIGHNLPQSQYRWDFNNDGIYDSQEINPSYVYSTSGNYTVKLIITTDALVDSVIIVDAVSARNRILSTPVNLQIHKEGQDIQISWEPVTTYTDNTPAQVGGYLIYQSMDISNTFQYLDYVTDCGYIHRNVILAKNHNFYIIIAHNGTVRDIIDYSRKNAIIHIPEISNKEKRLKK